MIASFRKFVRRAAGFTIFVAAALSATPVAAQDGDGGILGDDFATDSGAIVITADRIGANLFEPVEVPESSCLAAAPEVGSQEPGFVIDGGRFRKASDLERVRRKTRAGTIFVSGGNYVGQKFRKAKLYDMCFFDADMSQTDWREFSGTGIGFIDIDLTGANMSQTAMPFVLFRDTKLAEVDARTADFRNGQLDGGWEGSVRNLDLTGANLTGFRVRCGDTEVDGCPADREGLNLRDANLRRASFYDFFFPAGDLSGATIDQTELSLDHLPEIEGAKLVGPVVLRSDRRAVMLFPAEAGLLADVDAGEGEDGVDPCSGAVAGAVAVLCAMPGSEIAALLRSVTALEQTAATRPGYSTGMATWSATRDACLDLAEEQRNACLVSAYRTRQASLRGVAGSPTWLTRPGYRLFLSNEAAFPTATGRPGLYGRVLPILLDSASAAVIVKVDEEGNAEARGVAAGGCAFEVGDLMSVPETGSLNLSTVTGRGRRARRVPGDALLTFSGGDAVVDSATLIELGSCPSDSDVFPRLKAIALDDDLLADIYRRF